MPLLLDKKNASLTGVASSSLATRDVPVGGTIYDMYLYFETGAGVANAVADMKSEISKIKLRIDGDTIIDATPTQLLDLQKFYGDKNGAGNVAGVIPLHFASAILKSPEASKLFALGTADVSTITVEVECGTLVNVASIELYTSRSTEERKLGLHHRIINYPQNFATTGDQEISTLPKTQDIAYEALHIEDQAGTIVNVSVEANSNTVMDEIPANVQQVILANSGRTAQTGYYHATFNRLNESNGALPMAGVNDFRQTINWSVSPGGNYNIVAVAIHGLDIKTKTNG
jgi:hypothetical protein